MKKIALILLVIITVFQTKIYAQTEDDLLTVASLEGDWYAYDASKPGGLAQVEDYLKPASAKVKKKAMEKYKVTRLTFKKDFTYERVRGKGKNVFGEYKFDGDDIILMDTKGKVEEKGKLFFRNEDKEMGIVITIDNEKITILFKRK